MDEFELKPLNPNQQEEEEEDDEYADEDDLDKEALADSFDSMPHKRKNYNRFTIDYRKNYKNDENRKKEYNRIFGERAVDAVNIDELLDDDNIDLPKKYVDPKFIKYIMDKHNFQFRKTTAIEENSIDYVIKYTNGSPVFDEDGNPVFDEDGKITRPAREFHTDNGKFQIEGEYQKFKDDINYLYDEWKNEVLKKRIKKAGLIHGVVLPIAGLVFGLSLGLKRTGHNMVHDGKVKWEKLTLAEKKQIVIPWTELEKASGKGVILIGDYLYVLIGGTILVYLIKK